MKNSNSKIFNTVIIILIYISHVSAWLEFLKYFKPCYHSECCNSDYISYNNQDLLRDLNLKVFGQHIAIKRITNLMSTFHYAKLSKKPLVISLHGSTGVGKNYISSIIVDNIYKKGRKSNFVKMYSSRLDFPDESMTVHYKNLLLEEIKKVVSSCPRSMIIFDEVERLPQGVIDSIIPYLSQYQPVRGVDYSQATFIFISNLGGKHLTSIYLNLWNNGKLREDMVYEDFEQLLKNIAFNEKGGFEKADLVLNNDISWFIPLLPLERQHIKQCVEAEFKRMGARHQTNDEIEKIVEEIVIYHKGILSTTGCKTVTDRVSYYMAKLYSEL